MPKISAYHVSSITHNFNVSFPAQSPQTPWNISVRIISEVKERIGGQNVWEIGTLDYKE